MTDQRNFRDDITDTLELVREIHDRVIDAPLFPYTWRPDEYGAGPLRGGGTMQTHLFFAHPAADLRIEAGALDENRLELTFWMGGNRGRRIVFEVCAR